MNLRPYLPLALSLLPACGTDDDTRNEPVQNEGVAALRAALPTGERMAIRLPTRAALAPEQATFYGFTRDITLNVNGTVRIITNLLEDVVESPPSETDEATYAVWGPFQEPLSPAAWRVRVDLQDDGSYHYVVQGWPRNGDPAEAVTVLSGDHAPGADEHRGTGAWQYDLTAGNTLDPTSQPSLGRMDVAYDLADTRALEVAFTDVQGPGEPLSNSALYRYTEAADASGTLDFISNLDIHAESDPLLDRREVLQVRSRWLADGPGRSDVLATHGDLPAGTQVEVTECWDGGFMRTYVSYDFPQGHVQEGEPGACALLDLQLPVFEGFDADAFADGDLVQALPEPADVVVEPVPVQDPVAEPAVYLAATQQIVAGTNLHVKATLDNLRAMTRLPPSNCTPDGCVWGPYTDWNTRITSRLEVNRAAENVFTFSTVGKRFGEPDDAFAVLFEGGFTRGEGEDGEGWYVLDLSASAALYGTNDQGSVRVELSRQGGAARIDMRGDGIVGDDVPVPTDSRYALRVAPDGSGEVSFRFPADVDDGQNGRTAREDLEAHTRWLAGGVGQCGVRVSGGDVAEGQVIYGLQCWDARGALTHEAFAMEAADAEGRPAADPEACPFADWSEPAFPPLADE